MMGLLRAHIREAHRPTIGLLPRVRKTPEFGRRRGELTAAGGEAHTFEIGGAVDSMDGASICPLDSQYADQIAALLSPPPPEAVKDYYEQLLREREMSVLRVEQNGEHGKGLYADVEFIEGELVLKDNMLVGAQHRSNKLHCLVCSYCFRFIGSIELQIGRTLYFQSMQASDTTDHCNKSSNGSSKICEMDMSGDEDSGQYLLRTGDSNKNASIPKEVIESLMNGSMSLPHSEQFSLPSVTPCPGGCKEEQYCSKRCAEADWELFHSILCTGEASESPHREAITNFINHAVGSNDIFILAAKVIALTILKFKKLRSSCSEHWKPSKGKVKAQITVFPYLLEAWKPISMGFKGRWWDCIALPDDVDSLEEASFRMQFRDLAYESLQLLKDALFDEECAPYNSDLVVASPVEDFFIYIDELPQSEKEQAERITRPFLNALGDDYSVCCQGTAFFPLQSCINHSCHPNAKAFKRDEDRDGQAVVVALRSISKDEEITISYIDEELPYNERQVSLADYGFRCECIKCVDESSGDG